MTGITELGSGEPPPEGRRPKQIGPYRILEVLGEGGMGTVYLAEQREPVRRRVALKLIKLGMDTKAVVTRFEQERQALALMNHEGIAKVFDCGTTERGQPFFVMELVKGIPLDEFCDQNRLSLQDRLALIRQVCAAVQHAHQKGVVHRDLKPGNVLVSSEPGQLQVKIIDFGLAKAMGQKLVEATLFTEAGQIVGTPEYMAPEQADPSNEDIDTRADIYSLGVVLYLVLVGELPFPSDELRKAGMLEVQRVLREVDPPKPSTRLTTIGDAATELAKTRRVSVGALKKALKTDLDWVVLKALEKDRNRRYDTANALAADLQRYLDHEPVLAGPPSAGYRMKKLMRRYRGQFVTGGLVVLASLTFGSVAFVQWLRAEDLLVSETTAKNAAAQLAMDKSALAKAESEAKEEMRRMAEQQKAEAYGAKMALAYTHADQMDLTRLESVLDSLSDETATWDASWLRTLIIEPGKEFDVPRTLPVMSVDYDPLAGELLLASLDGKVWSLCIEEDPPGTPRPSIEVGSAVWAVRIAPSRDRVAIGTKDGAVQVWSRSVTSGAAEQAASTNATAWVKVGEDLVLDAKSPVLDLHWFEDSSGLIALQKATVSSCSFTDRLTASGRADLPAPFHATRERLFSNLTVGTRKNWFAVSSPHGGTVVYGLPGLALLKQDPPFEETGGNRGVALTGHEWQGEFNSLAVPHTNSLAKFDLRGISTEVAVEDETKSAARATGSEAPTDSEIQQDLIRRLMDSMKIQPDGSLLPASTTNKGQGRGTALVVPKPGSTELFPLADNGGMFRLGQQLAIWDSVVATRGRLWLLDANRRAYRFLCQLAPENMGTGIGFNSLPRRVFYDDQRDLLITTDASLLRTFAKRPDGLLGSVEFSAFPTGFVSVPLMRNSLAPSIDLEWMSKGRAFDSAVVSPNGRFVVLVGDRDYVLFDSVKMKLVAVWPVVSAKSRSGSLDGGWLGTRSKAELKRCAAVSSDGSLVARIVSSGAGDSDWCLEVYDVAGGQLAWIHDLGQATQPFILPLAGGDFLVGTDDAVMTMNSDGVHTRLDGIQSGGYSVSAAFVGATESTVAFVRDDEIRVLTLKSGKLTPAATLPWAAQKPARAAEFAPDGSHLYVLDDAGTVFAVEPINGTILGSVSTGLIPSDTTRDGLRVFRSGLLMAADNDLVSFIVPRKRDGHVDLTSWQIRPPRLSQHTGLDDGRGNPIAASWEMHRTLGVRFRDELGIVLPSERGLTLLSPDPARRLAMEKEAAAITMSSRLGADRNAPSSVPQTLKTRVDRIQAISNRCVDTRQALDALTGEVEKAFSELRYGDAVVETFATRLRSKGSDALVLRRLISLLSPTPDELSSGARDVCVEQWKSGDEGRFRVALNDVEIAIAKRPPNTPQWVNDIHNLALAQHRLGRNVEALKTLESARPAIDRMGASTKVTATVQEWSELIEALCLVATRDSARAKAWLDEQDKSSKEFSVPSWVGTQGRPSREQFATLKAELEVVLKTANNAVDKR
jgi:tRNA A-37 threonylcarbamoyl transferase component Bud32